MEDTLKHAGLNEAQATVYLYVLKNGESAPPTVARACNLTRSNAYKVLDSLVDAALLRRTEVNKKFVYRPEDPIALTNLVAQERNRVIALEQSVREAMHELRTTYEKTADSGDVRTYRGSQAVTAQYVSQAKKGQPIYFVKSRADIPALGFETMDKIRSLPAKNNTERHGITPDSPEAPLNPGLDRETKLSRTWIHSDDYTSPVEWSVSGDELLIVDFDSEPSAIRISNSRVAKAFRELWHLIDDNVRANPEYKKLPKQADRKI